MIKHANLINDERCVKPLKNVRNDGKINLDTDVICAGVDEALQFFHLPKFGPVKLVLDMEDDAVDQGTVQFSNGKTYKVLALRIGLTGCCVTVHIENEHGTKIHLYLNIQCHEDWFPIAQALKEMGNLKGSRYMGGVEEIGSWVERIR